LIHNQEVDVEASANSLCTHPIQQLTQNKINGHYPLHLKFLETKAGDLIDVVAIHQAAYPVHLKFLSKRQSSKAGAMLVESVTRVLRSDSVSFHS
jgi:hypothetical protein